MTSHKALSNLLASAPTNWSRRRFRFATHLRTEKNTNSDLPLLSVSATNGIRLRGEGGLGRQAPAEKTITSYWKVSPGDIVINPMWVIEGGVSSSTLDGAVSPAYRVYRPAGDVNARYLHHLLRSQPYIDQYNQFVRGVTTFDRSVSKEDFADLPILLPPVDEQRRIADFLDAETSRIERLAAHRSAQQRLLDERAYAEVSEVLIPGSLGKNRRNSRWPWLPATMHGVPLVRLGYVCRLQNGLTVDGKRNVAGDVVTRPYLRVANVQAGHVNLNSVAQIAVPQAIASRSTLKRGDVLMTEGGDLDKLGRGTVWNGELDNCLHQNHVFALRPEVEKLDGIYLALMTQTLHGRCYFESTGSRTTNLASTNSSKILSFPIPLPPLQKQKTLASQVQHRLQLIRRTGESLGNQLSLLAERRQALITAAVTGQFDVSSASGRGVTEGVPSA